MTTTDKNAEIAKWMQYDGHMYDKDLKYHSDWNWLMGTILKIRDCKHQHGWGYHNAICASLIECNIENTHEAVYQFVVWHNQQVKETPKP